MTGQGFNMSKEQTDLAACPLCNSAMAIEQFVGWDGEDLPVKHVTHPKSECPLSGLQFEARGEAIEAWNRRASPSPAGGVQGVAEKLLAEVEGMTAFVPAIREVMGNTNWAVLRQRADELRAALSSQAQTTGGVE